MTKFTRYFKCLCIAFILLSQKGNSQGCQSNFTYSLGPNGQVSFVNTCTGTTSLTIYSWNFGAPYLSSYSGTFASQPPMVTYTANGNYIVILNISSATPSCNSTFTVSIPVSSIITPTCSINFSTSPAASTVFCSGSATANAVGLCGTLTYTWLPATSNPTSATQFSLCPINYTVLVSGSTTTGNCCPTASAIVTIPLFTCSLNAGFTKTVAPSSGLVNFASTSTGTSSSSTFNWNYGDGSATGTGVAPAHSYSATGSYSVKLVVNNNSFPSCIDTLIQLITVNVYTCYLAANFTSSVIASQFVYFNNTCTGSLSTTSYTWNFGDGSVSIGPAVNHSYTVPGNYTVTLTAAHSSTPFCTSVKILTVFVPSVNCNITAAFSHTVGAAGIVTFSSNYLGAPAKRFWNFGDGYTAVVANPTHTYSNAGTHFVTLVVTDTTYAFCRDSLIQSINITGISCMANSVFTLVPTGTPKFWNAIPNYPYNVSAAVWSWGDGSTSNGLYTSHVYSVAATYTICLSVTVSCGSSSSYCFPYAISKPAGGGSGSDAYSINVVAPALSLDLHAVESDYSEFIVFPNPNHGSFSVLLQGFGDSDVGVSITDVFGKSIITLTIRGDGVHPFGDSNLSAGLYFLKVTRGDKTRTKKLLINN